jgi:hypothetical protein
MGAKVSDALNTIPTDFFTEDGFLISITIPSHPANGDTIKLNEQTYVVISKAWDFDVGGIPLLVRIKVQ